MIIAKGAKKMKIRNGFVSNSSSSSFVVAFPRKPKSEKDVLDFMFGGKEGGIGSVCYNDGLSYRQVSERVYRDIEKRTTLNELIEELLSRYCYYPSGHNIIFLGGERDYYGGSFPQKTGRYFCSDNKLKEEFRKAVTERTRKSEKLRERETRIMCHSNIKDVPCAYRGGMNYQLNRVYTDEEIRASDDYQNALAHFRKNDPDYLKYKKDRQKSRMESEKNINSIRRKLAKKDAQNFIDDNKGKYIFVVNYGDESGDGVMEHGDIFRNVPHLVICHH